MAKTIAGAKKRRDRRRILKVAMTGRTEVGHSRPGYVREVTLTYRWVRVPEWLETTTRVYGARHAWPFFRSRLENRVREALMALYLSASNVPLAVEVVHVGSMAETPCDPAEILRSALQLGARGVIVAHNHPSGSPRPSYMDEHSFDRLKEAGELLGIQILDSLIVVPGTYYSIVDGRNLAKVQENHKEMVARRAARAQARAARAARRDAAPAPAPDAQPAIAPTAQGA